jgi:hypothetical protein
MHGMRSIPKRVQIGHKNLAQAAILILAGIVLFGSYWLNKSTDGPNNATNNWWSSLLQNFGAGLCSALVLIWLYDRVIEHEANKIKAERNRIAAQQLVVPLRSQIYGLLFAMYRSAVANKPEIEIKSWKEFLTVHFPEQIPYLDLSKRSPGSYPAVTLYSKYISDHMSRFSMELQTWLNKYGTVVDADLVESVELVTSSNFMWSSSTLDQFVNFSPPPPFPQGVDWPALYKFDPATCHEYGTRLSDLVDAVERKLPEPISKFQEGYWRNQFFEIGYARRG